MKTEEGGSTPAKPFLGWTAWIRENIANIIALVAVVCAMTEAGAAFVAVNSYKRTAVFEARVKTCAEMMEGSTEFRVAVQTYENQAFPDRTAARAKLAGVQDTFSRAVLKVETLVDTLSLLGPSDISTHAKALARKADAYVVRASRSDLSKPEFEAWVADFDRELAEAALACKKDLAE